MEPLGQSKRMDCRRTLLWNPNVNTPGLINLPAPLWAFQQQPDYGSYPQMDSVTHTTYACMHTLTDGGHTPVLNTHTHTHTHIHTLKNSINQPVLRNDFMKALCFFSLFLFPFLQTVVNYFVKKSVQ